MMSKKYPKAIVSAPLVLGDTELTCAVLDDGNNTRILSASAVFEAFDRPRKGQNNRLEIDNIPIPPFLAAKNLQSFIGKDLLDILKQVEYLDGTKVVKGYDARILPKLCSLYLEARRENKLIASQEKFAIKAEILQSALSEIGIVALVDEATGFQYSRKYDALRVLLEHYINDGIQKWVKRFPDDFFVELDKIYDNPATTSRTRPQYYGKFINKYIYEPIERGYLKEELNKLNITDEGTRKARFHQWLTEFGAQQLTLQIGGVMSILRISPNLEKFKNNMRRQQGLSIQPSLFENDFE
jgi:hypothetical protein